MNRLDKLGNITITVIIELESKYGRYYERYQNIIVDTLLLGGAKSPKYLRDALITLEKTIPHAKRVELNGLDHGASTTNLEIITIELKKFFK